VELSYLCNMNYNFLYSNSFERKFNRKPKEWTIEQIHALYEKAKERSNKRWKSRSEFIKEIVDKIPKNSKDEHVIYYYHPKDNNNIYYYTFKYNSEYRSHSIGQGRVEFSKDIVAGRQEKLDFILSHDESFELGQEYYKLDKMCSYLEYRVMKILWMLIEDKLRVHFKKTDTLPKSVFIIDIGTKKYYVKVDDQHRFGYMTFHLGGEYTDEIIKID